ncbi:MAG: hypothetical protein R3E12_15995 [Candidatus Eisenbacteria bacterium]
MVGIVGAPSGLGLVLRVADRDEGLRKQNEKRSVKMRETGNNDRIIEPSMSCTPSTARTA